MPIRQPKVGQRSQRTRETAIRGLARHDSGDLVSAILDRHAEGRAGSCLRWRDAGLLSLDFLFRLTDNCHRLKQA
jgi:hypothetical protein